MNTKAAFHVVQVQVGREPIVWIVDDYQSQRPTMTVTNDAEAVCAVVHARYPNHRIIYRDTDGHWDELWHRAGVFKGFLPARSMVPEQEVNCGDL